MSAGNIVGLFQGNFILRCLVVLLLTLTLRVSATTYYIDYNSGSDSNVGTSPGTPWKLHPYMRGFTGIYTHKAGDRFIFKGGVTWPASVLPLLYTSGAGGASGNSDYYGADSTYYTGTVWTRPILDGDAAAHVAFWLVNYNNITIDNFDFPNYGMSGGIINAYRGTGIVIKNCYFHAWTHSSFTTDDLKCINGDSAQPANGNVIDSCIFTGSPNATDSGMAVYHWSGDIINCIATNLSNGFLPNSGTVSNCLIGPINNSFDVNQHENSIEQIGSGRMDICNNVIRNATAVCIFTGNPGGPTYVYNNLIYNSQPIPIQFDGRGGAFNAYVYNNTVVSTETGSAMRCVGLATVTLYAYNNHLIDGGIASTFAAVNQGNNFSQTLAQAATAGYTSANGWKPVSGMAPTIDSGIATTLFSKDLLFVSRPQGVAWDIGAYEAGGGVASTNPIIRVTPISQNFGSVAVGATKNLTFNVQNAGSGTLAGTASAASPFSIVSGGTYSLGSNQTQTITVRYAPSVAGSQSQTITLTGGGGASVLVSGAAWAVQPSLSF